jgi:hypothetical protein
MRGERFVLMEFGTCLASPFRLLFEVFSRMFDSDEAAHTAWCTSRAGEPDTPIFQ